MTTRFLTTTLALLTLSAAAMAADAPAKFAGGALVDAKGMTLYTFDKDTAGSGKSVCNGQCATLWPPAMATAADQPSGDFGIVTRDDGSRQWSFKGKPVYTYQADKKAGERTGDNFRDVWHIVKE
jgi:predicted lipoprotein with Yx(FWY)xxD motif